MLCAKVFYFKGVMGVGASYARHRTISQGEMESFSTAGSAFWIYVRKDYRILVRTPVFFMNNFLMNFLFPVFFFVPLVMAISGEGGDFGKILNAIRTASFGEEAFAGPIVLGALSALAIFVCGMNGITASAISREGGCAYIMKVIPMSYRSQVRAKVAMGVLVSAVPALILLVAAIVLLLPPFWFTLLMVVVLAGAVLLPNLMGILFDLARPKLHWTDEQKAVKQNMNVLYAMGVSMVLAALACVPAVLLQMRFGPKAAIFSYIAAVGFPLLADLLFYVLMNRNAPRALRAMHP
jgi:ABC-2 type transport system permease protein